MVNFFSSGLDFTSLVFDTADPDSDWVVATGSPGQLGSTFTAFLDVSAKVRKLTKFTNHGYKSMNLVIRYP